MLITHVHIEIRLITRLPCVRPQTLAERAWRSSIEVLQSVIVLGADAPITFTALSSTPTCTCHPTRF